ncbi:hypothetical protein SAMN05216436_11425 [bacterium A37T11]|nr:hypothetical protein SAMN05216436_11425 [bacterium A37T11]
MKKAFKHHPENVKLIIPAEMTEMTAEAQELITGGTRKPNSKVFLVAQAMIFYFTFGIPLF